MNNRIDTKRILIFLVIAFAIAWATALVIYLIGGAAHSPQRASQPQLALTVVILEAVVIMTAPAIGHILTRLITREGWRDTTLRPHFTQGTWIFWLTAYLLPAGLIAAGAALYFALFPSYYDPTMSSVRDQLAAAATQTGQTLPISAEVFVILQLASGLLLGPVVNGIATLGEEFGWRGYLQPKLMPLGPRKALIVTGLIWGVWHWPLVAMGHNYGVYTNEYPGAPWSGLAMTLVIFVCLGVLLGWLALRSRSVWPAVLGHAMFNAYAGAPLFFAQGEPNLLIGPLSVGIVGGVGLIVSALAILLVPGAFAQPSSPTVNKVDDAAATDLKIKHA